VQEEDVADEISDTYDHRRFTDNLKFVNNSNGLLSPTSRSKGLSFSMVSTSPKTDTALFKSMKEFLD
jgi:hypothetical protein